jgi:phenylacetate-CoA ligase
MSKRNLQKEDLYWQKDEETVDRPYLEACQLHNLRLTLKRVYENVPFYRERFEKAGVTPDDFRDLRDIQKLPFTTNVDLRETYPRGLVALKGEGLMRLHTSSGTTGKPKAIFFSRQDIDNSANLIARALTMTGTGKDDVLQNMMTYGLFTGAFVMHYGAEKVGALVIPAGPGNTDRQISLMQDFGSTAIHLTPSYALYVAGVLKERGIDVHKDLCLKRAYMGAEPYTEETRGKIESSLGIDVYNCYGLTEMNGPGVAFECVHKSGLHIWEDYFLIEIINPETGEVLPEGEKGEMVLTTLRREAMPLIRYRTRDITRIIPEPCACGRTHRLISRMLGRSDDMFIARGVNIFPQQIEQALMGIKGVAQNYQIILESLDDITVRVEISKDLFDGNIDHLINLRKEITDKLRAAIIVKPKVELLEPGALPVSEGKAKRVIDNRTM